MTEAAVPQEVVHNPFDLRAVDMSAERLGVDEHLVASTCSHFATTWLNRSGSPRAGGGPSITPMDSRSRSRRSVIQVIQLAILAAPRPAAEGFTKGVQRVSQGVPLVR
jgi:hypothetical protein